MGYSARDHLPHISLPLGHLLSGPRRKPRLEADNDRDNTQHQAGWQSKAWSQWGQVAVRNLRSAHKRAGLKLGHLLVTLAHDTNNKNAYSVPDCATYFMCIIYT